MSKNTKQALLDEQNTIDANGYDHDDRVFMIKEACAEANPLLYISTSHDWFRKTGDEEYDSENVASEAIFTIADILLALNYEYTSLDDKNWGVVGSDGFFIQRGKTMDTGYWWMLKHDDLEKQSNETIDFIYNLLSGEDDDK